MLNQAILIGTVGAKPTLGYTKRGTPVMNMSVCTSEVWVPKELQNSDEHRKRIEWHRVTMFGMDAERFYNKLEPNDLVMVVGIIQTRNWIDKMQVKRYTTEIVAKTIRKVKEELNPEIPVDMLRDVPNQED